MTKLYDFAFIFIQNIECPIFENKKNRYKNIAHTWSYMCLKIRGCIIIFLKTQPKHFYLWRWSL